jgi:hypothetical protein
MFDTDRKEFAGLMNAVMSFYGKDLSPVSLGLWWEAMRSFALVDIRQALNIHVTNPDAGQFPPKPADVIRYLRGSTTTQGLSAWSKVEKAIRQVGPYQTVVFDDPKIHAVITDMGGWLKLCEGTEDEFPFKAREFERRYQGYALNPPREYPRSLVGIAEADNRLNNQRIAPPVLIGDEQKALACYRGGGEMPAFPVNRPKSITELLGGEPQPEARRIPKQLENNQSKPEPFKSDPAQRERIKAEIDKALRGAESA